MIVIFKEDRGQFKKGTVLKVTDEQGSQLINTGKEGSVVEAPEEAKVTDKSTVLGYIKSLKNIAVKEAVKKVEALKE